MIRLATFKDLKEVAILHSKCFPDSYATQLGKYNLSNSKNLICKFYQEFLDSAPELFWVAEADNQIIAFCVGYYMNNDSQINSFVKKNKFNIVMKTLLLLLLLNKPTWKKLLFRIVKRKGDLYQVVDHSNDHIQKDYIGDLLSICVNPSYRGRGIAQELMRSFMNSLKNSGMQLCYLSVRSDNIKAIKSYERSGFKLYRVRGTVGQTYMKLL